MFVTRALRHLLGGKQRPLEMLLAAAGGLSLLLLCLLRLFRSVDHPLWHVGNRLPTPYEFLVAGLVIPLLWTSCSGWLRLVFIWASLKEDLLGRLENQPIRVAFNRLRGTGWMNLLGRAGLREQWRDMHRCIESMAQMLHQPGLIGQLDRKSSPGTAQFAKNLVAASGVLCGSQGEQDDLPRVADYQLIRDIDRGLAEFGRRLLQGFLIPYWNKRPASLVESDRADDLPVKVRRWPDAASRTWIPIELQAGPSMAESLQVAAAEEFIAIRYMSLIRAVLANIRYSMAFVSITFVLSIVAWNSYPFEPRDRFDWLFTALLIVIGFGMVWVFGQMHRDPILSRLTNTTPNELGWDFYLRVISFGAIPLLTWLAYQFPDISGTIYKFLQPGASVFK